MKLRLIDADKLLTKAQDYGEGQEKLILIDPYYVKKAETVQAIPIPDNATNGDVVEKIFGKDVYYTLIRMMYSSCCEKLKDWWNAPYKRGSEDGSN